MTYDLRSLQLPRLGSRPLRLLVRALELPVIGPLLVEKLRRDGGVNRLRALDIREPPTFLPQHPPDDPDIPALAPDDGRNVPYADTVASSPGPSGFRFHCTRDFVEAYRRQALTPVDVAERFLSQWRASDEGPRPLRAFISVRTDDLHQQARASADRWRRGVPLGPWDGVPVAIKDEVDVAGYGTTLGTRFLGRVPASNDATVVARLRTAGALIVGKANMHEFGINVTGFNPHHGTARNPYHDEHYAGGSSSGPAVAVASGLVPVAIGADGGGSIRIPAAFCGVVGLKPTFGRVSEYGVPPLVWSVAHIGPIAASAADCAAAYALIAGDDSHDPGTYGHPPVSVDSAPPGSLRGIRLGVYRAWFSHAAPAVVARCEETLDALAAAGADITDVEIPELDLQRVAHVAIITGEMASAVAPFYSAHRQDFALDTRLNIRLAQSFAAAELVSAARVRTKTMAMWREVFRTVHAVVTPATGQVAPVIRPESLPDGGSDLAATTEIMRFAFAPNLTGHPAISFPAGYDARGLPVGMQVIGRPWSERLLFRLAAAAERVVVRHPPQRRYALLDD